MCGDTCSDLRGRDGQESSGLQLVDPTVQDRDPLEIYLDQVYCKLGGQEKKGTSSYSFLPANIQNAWHFPEQSLTSVIWVFGLELCSG